MKPIADKAEIAIDFPDKTYMGSFGRHSGFEAHADDKGIVVKLAWQGPEKRVFEMHLHYLLFAALLREVGESLKTREPLDDLHRQTLATAADTLHGALKAKRNSKGR